MAPAEQTYPSEAALGEWAFNARWDSPERGSFTGRDGSLQFWSPYGFVRDNPVTDIDSDGKANYGNASTLLSVGNQALNNENFKPIGERGTKDRKTFCNFATQFIVNAAGSSYELNNKTGGKANAMYKDLQNPGFAREVSEDEAKSLANEGVTVIGAWYNPKGDPGHVSVVSPTIAGDDPDDIYFFQIGGTVGRKNLEGAFSSHADDTKLYVLEEDVPSMDLGSGIVPGYYPGLDPTKVFKSWKQGIETSRDVSSTTDSN